MHHSEKDFLGDNEVMRKLVEEHSLDAGRGRAEDSLERQLALQRPSVGATGEHPEGRLTEDDEGEIQFAVAADKAAGKVVIDFGKPVAWMGMNASQARDLGMLLFRGAGQVDGAVTTISFDGVTQSSQGG